MCITSCAVVSKRFPNSPPGKIPCIVAMLDDGDWDNDRFMHLMGNDNATKFYFGDTMQPTTIVKKEEDATA